MGSAVRMKKQIYLGLFLITLSSLAYEILLTRIFSVTMWYHFAFLAISIAMFGMTVGALLVYLLPNYFPLERTVYHLSLSSFLFSLTMVGSFLIYLKIPFVKQISIKGLASYGLTYLVISAPFIFSGITVCLALTRFPTSLSKLYAVDLLGAGTGCVLLIHLLKITDAPTGMILVSLFAGMGAFFFIIGERSPRLRRSIILLNLILATFALINHYFKNQMDLLNLRWVKGERVEERPIYEKWNSYSYITVSGNPNLPTKPFGWGLSELYPREHKVRQLFLKIDGSALTPITAFKGDFSELSHLKYDLSNLVYYLKNSARVLVIGAGGGRDVLSALLFGQKSIVAVEVNSEILKALNQRFGDFSGHLDQQPGVRFVNAEARSYLASSQEQFDIIQVSLIDTWAATSAGALILAEHSLYTVEAWKDFLNHLTPEGILSFTYWYTPRDTPVGIYRMISLARTALGELGKKNPREHLVIVRHIYPIMKEMPETELPAGVVTMLISNQGFSEQELNQIETIARELKFELVLSPRFSLNPIFAELVSGKTPMQAFKFPVNLKATRDRNPFFFYVLRFQDGFKPRLWKEIAQVAGTGPLLAVFILTACFIITLSLTFLFIFLPLLLTTEKKTLKGGLRISVFFIAIGFGFMLIEISQLQRLIIFLGHPVYGLSVVLFSILLGSGVGSYLTQGIGAEELKSSGLLRFLLLLLALLFFGILSPYLINLFRTSITPVRVLVGGLMLFSVGLFMGMPFPLGMKSAFHHSPALTPWLWGINGASSVCASVLGLVISLNSSISFTFWTGFGFYLLALIAFLALASRLTISGHGGGDSGLKSV